MGRGSAFMIAEMTGSEPSRQPGARQKRTSLLDPVIDVDVSPEPAASLLPTGQEPKPE
jgi:hypothetical protein